jgi:GT2 family glycosyltransferase
VPPVRHPGAISMSRVAVIIVNYNAGAMLRECLAALAAQTMRPARVLVVDNGSRDGSLEAAGKGLLAVGRSRLLPSQRVGGGGTILRALLLLLRRRRSG